MFSNLRKVLEQLHQSDALAAEPLAQARCIQAWIEQNPDAVNGQPRGKVLALALADYWRRDYHPVQIPVQPGRPEEITDKLRTQTERFLILELRYLRPAQQAGRSQRTDEEVMVELQNSELLKSTLEQGGTRLVKGWEQCLAQIARRFSVELGISTLRYHRDRAIADLTTILMRREAECEPSRQNAPVRNAQPPAAEDHLLGRVLGLSILRRRVTCSGATEDQIETCLAEISSPDRALIKSAFAPADSALLYCLSKHLAHRWQSGPPSALYPVPIDLNHYAPRANTESLLSYAANRWLNDRASNDERALFRATLADLESQGRVLWVAGTWDALTAEEGKQVLPRFQEVGHYIVITRAWEPQLEFNQRYPLPLTAIANPGQFIRERLEITPHLANDLQARLGCMAFYDLNRGVFAEPDLRQLSFKESDVHCLHLTNKPDYLEQARRAGILLYDGVNFRCDAGVANYLAGSYALLDPSDYHFHIIELALRRRRHPLLEGVVQVFAHTQDWLLLDRLINAFAAFSSESPLRDKVELLGLGILAAADLVAQIQRVARPPAPEEQLQHLRTMLAQLAGASNTPEVQAAVAQRLRQLDQAPAMASSQPTDYPIVAPPRPQAAAVSDLLAQLGSQRLAARVARGADWTKDAEIIDCLVAAVAQPGSDQGLLAACLHHADLDQRLLPKKGGLAGLLAEAPTALSYLVNQAVAETDRTRRSTLVSILANPGILRVLASCGESGEWRSLMQAIAVQIDAYVIRQHRDSEVFVRGQ